MAELSETLVQPRMPRGAAATLAVLAILLGLAALFAQQIPSWWPMATPEGMSSRASAALVLCSTALLFLLFRWRRLGLMFAVVSVPGWSSPSTRVLVASVLRSISAASAC